MATHAVSEKHSEDEELIAEIEKKHGKSIDRIREEREKQNA